MLLLSYDPATIDPTRLKVRIFWALLSCVNVSVWSSASTRKGMGSL